MRAMLPVAAVAAAAGLSACNPLAVDKVADAKARAFYEQLRTGADLAANPDLAAELKTPQILPRLAEVKDSLPPGAPTAVANRSWNLRTGTGGTRATLVHAYSYPAATVLAETVLARGADKAWKIVGFHVRFADPSGALKPASPVTAEKPNDI
jgi:hypothetical protein